MEGTGQPWALGVGRHGLSQGRRLGRTHTLPHCVGRIPPWQVGHATRRGIRRAGLGFSCGLGGWVLSQQSFQGDIGFAAKEQVPLGTVGGGVQ